MSDSLPVGTKEYIEKLAAADPFDTLDYINWDSVTDEFIKLAHPGVAYLEVERKRRHFITVRRAEISKSFYGKKNEYFGEFWIEFNFPVWIGVIFRMFEKIVVFINFIYRKTFMFKRVV